MKNLYYLLFIVLVGLTTSKMINAQITCTNEVAIFNDYDVYAALPNIFTPNNDGLNDLLTIYNSFAQQRFIEISDTSASNIILFSTDATDETAYWDGLDMNGVEVPEAAYNLRVDYLFDNGTVILTCRTIYLVRENCINLNDVELDFPADFDDLNITFTDNNTTLPPCIVSINEQFIVNATISPTLAQQEIIVNSSEPVSSYKIFNLSGKTLLVSEINNASNLNINVSQLKTGTYFLLLNHYGKYSSHQFFKE